MGSSSFLADKGHPKEAVSTKQKKVPEQILRNLAKSCENCQFLAYGGPNQDPADPLRVIQ